MELTVKELIKLILTKENMTQKELVQELCRITGGKYTQDGLSRKLSRGTMTVMISRLKNMRPKPALFP